MNQYQGTENLEVMSEAVNYNNYLIDLILCNFKKEGVILDFGAGIGTFANKINKYHNKVICLEIDETQASKIKKLGIKVYTDIDEISENSIDYIYSLNVLEHIEKDFETLDLLYSKLQDGGKVLLYLPAFNVLYSSMDDKVGHYRRYDNQMVKDLVSKTRFKLQDIRYVDSIGFFAAIVYKYLGSKEGKINKNNLIFYDRIIFPLSIVMDKIFHKFFGKNIYAVLEKGYSFEKNITKK